MDGGLALGRDERGAGDALLVVLEADSVVVDGDDAGVDGREQSGIGRLLSHACQPCEVHELGPARADAGQDLRDAWQRQAGSARETWL